MQIAKAMKLKEAPAGSVIFDHRDQADSIYILLEGTADLQTPHYIEISVQDQLKRKAKLAKMNEQIEKLTPRIISCKNRIFVFDTVRKIIA